MNWSGWDGPIKTLRGEVEQQDPVEDPDPWVSRIVISSNDNPNIVERATMRVQGSDKKGLGAFYIPQGYHLKILLGSEDMDGGWWYSTGACPNSTACSQ